MVCRLVSYWLLRQVCAARSGGAGNRRGEGDEGGIISLPRILLQSLSRRGADLQHSRQLRIEYRVSLRKKFSAFLCIACGATLALGAAKAATVCDARAYGAKADGTTMDTNGIQAAIDACAKKGGGKVSLDGGTFLSGPIVLKSNIDLDIAKGTTLQGSSKHEDYPRKTEFRNPGLQSLVSATNASNVSITGGGVIDGAGESWWKEARGQGDHGIMGQGMLRPRLVVFDHSRKILMEGVTVQNSPFWQIVLYYSDDVTIRNVRVLADPHSPNTDAIDPFSSSNIRIEHVYADVGDDDVAIKSGQAGSPGPDAPSKDITISDCTFMHGHGLSIGSEISGGVQNVHATRVQFKGTDNGCGSSRLAIAEATSAILIFVI